MTYRVYMPLLTAVIVAGTSPVFAQQGGQSQQSDQKVAQEKASGSGTQLFVSPAAVRQIQQALNKKGYDPGNVDGTWGESTSNAVRNFQQAQKLEPTGSLTVETIAALGVTDVISGQGGGQGQTDQKLTQEAAQSKGTQLMASPSTVRQIQQALNKKGYDAGDVQGKWTEQTSTAMRNFQQAQGLEPTGNLTISSISKLGVAQSLTQLAQSGSSGASQQQGGAAAGQTGGGQGQDQKLAQEQAVDQGTPIHISPADLRQIEQALNKKGYDAGSVDGNWDNQVQSALRNFQQAQGLEPTGNVNTRTLGSLGVGQQVLSGQSGGQQQSQGSQQQGQSQQGQSGQQGQSQQQQEQSGQQPSPMGAGQSQTGQTGPQ